MDVSFYLIGQFSASAVDFLCCISLCFFVCVFEFEMCFEQLWCSKTPVDKWRSWVCQLG